LRHTASCSVYQGLPPIPWRLRDLFPVRIRPALPLLQHRPPSPGVTAPLHPARGSSVRFGAPFPFFWNLSLPPLSEPAAPLLSVRLSLYISSWCGTSFARWKQRLCLRLTFHSSGASLVAYSPPTRRIRFCFAPFDPFLLAKWTEVYRPYPFFNNFQNHSSSLVPP